MGDPPTSTQTEYWSKWYADNSKFIHKPTGHTQELSPNDNERECWYEWHKNNDDYYIHTPTNFRKLSVPPTSDELAFYHQWARCEDISTDGYGYRNSRKYYYWNMATGEQS